MYRAPAAGLTRRGRKSEAPAGRHRKCTGAKSSTGDGARAERRRLLPAERKPMSPPVRVAGAGAQFLRVGGFSAPRSASPPLPSLPHCLGGSRTAPISLAAAAAATGGGWW
ncbi:uncharacterized protein Tco025E_07095 [Trypanosoma conorhini]|uniref:Uncharacterized protein n=1 Tax=Trypanosoma conorhini TaxID=83891 RepID=A0A422NTH1_9TRYP|nr:uncharacterized protein Tco025E_07095 [Trypanosoma conorhini]RNF08763.1 hypothetical protein Tco025E_07095 [Trypanosoma conorhini]